MTTEQALKKMDDMVETAARTWFPPDFSFAVYVPLEMANLVIEHYNKLSPFNSMVGPLAAGEPFLYKGVKCFAS